MKALAFVGFVASCFALVELAAACSGDDDPPPAVPGSNSPTAPGGGNLADGGSRGDGGGLDAASACVGPTQQGADLPATEIRSEVPPPLGGEIRPGTYILSELDVYLPADPDAGDDPIPPTTTERGRGTLIVTDQWISRLETRASGGAAFPADSLSAFSYTVSGKNLVLTPICGASGEVKTIGFSAVGGGFALFPDATHRELYIKAP